MPEPTALPCRILSFEAPVRPAAVVVSAKLGCSHALRYFWLSLHPES